MFRRACAHTFETLTRHDRPEKIRKSDRPNPSPSLKNLSRASPLTNPIGSHGLTYAQNEGNP